MIIVLHILSYDNKTIKNGKIVNIVNKLDRIKYQNIIHLLENKPKIKYMGRIMDLYRGCYQEHVTFHEKNIMNIIYYRIIVIVMNINFVKNI